MITKASLEEAAQRFEARGDHQLAGIARSIFANEDLSPKQEAYQEFFRSKMSEFGVESPADLSEEQKKQFFNSVKEGWKGEASVAYAGLCECLAGVDITTQQTLASIDDKVTLMASLIERKIPFIYTSNGTIEVA